MRNYHLKDGIYFRREGDMIRIVQARDFTDPGEVLVETDINGFSSIIASMSPWQEQNGSFDYVFEFIVHGVMYCGGCGAKIIPEDPIGSGGFLSIVKRIACNICYEQKFKPLFDWGLESRKETPI